MCPLPLLLFFFSSLCFNFVSFVLLRVIGPAFVAVVVLGYRFILGVVLAGIEMHEDTHLFLTHSENRKAV